MSAVLVDPRGNSRGEVIRRLPHQYVMSRHPRARYMHLPRTAKRYEINGRSWLGVSALCGQHVSNPLFSDDPGSAVCGTCLGRDLGITEPDVLFAPRLLHQLPPKWCAGPRRGLVYDDRPRSRLGICLMCDQVVEMWGNTMRAHEHRGTGLVCPEHGTTWLTQTYRHWGEPTGQVVCNGWGSCEHCQLRPRRFWVVAPHGREAAPQ